jgi:hypothetical protein
MTRRTAREGLVTLNAADSGGKIYSVWSTRPPPYRQDQRNATNAVQPATPWQMRDDW